MGEGRLIKKFAFQRGGGLLARGGYKEGGLKEFLNGILNKN